MTQLQTVDVPRRLVTRVAMTATADHAISSSSQPTTLPELVPSRQSRTGSPQSSYPTRQATFVDLNHEGVVLGLPKIAGKRGRPSRRRQRSSVSASTGLLNSDYDPATGLKKSWLTEYDIVNPFNYTVDELHQLVQGKITSGFHGLRQLFSLESNNGILSRSSLHKVLMDSCGYVSDDLFSRYLKRLGLQHAQYISFEMFVSRFSNLKVVRENWLFPLQRQAIKKEEPKIQERHLRHPDIVYKPVLVPASYVIVGLRDLVRSGKFEPATQLAPPVVEGKEGLLKAELRSLVSSLLGLSMSDNEMDKLWSRFDLHGSVSVDRDTFYKVIGFKSPSIPVVAKEATSHEASCPSSPNKERTAMTSKVQLPFIPKSDGKPISGFRSIVEELIYHLELPAINLTEACRWFDQVGDNFIAKIDLRTVLKQFGFPIGALDFETFTSRNHLRVLNDLLEYKEFVYRFTLREDHGMVSRVINDPKHLYSREPQSRLRRSGAGTGGWSAEELEAGLIEYLMGDYLRFISSLRAADSNSTGFISQPMLNSILEKKLKRSITTLEWTKFLKQVGCNREGSVCYENIIALLNKRRPTWNIKDNLGHKVKVMPYPQATAELEKIHAIAVEDKAMMHERFKQPESERSIDEVSQSIRELMKTRFQKLDFAYRQRDRKMTGRLDSSMLLNVLKDCGLTLKPEEVETLWKTFALAADGLYTWSKFCQRYVSDEIKLKQALRGQPATPGASDIQNVEVKEEQGPRTMSDPVLSQIRQQVASHMDSLTRLFRELDKRGQGQVERAEAEEAFIALKVNVSIRNLVHIIQLFDLERSAKFHYREFLRVMRVSPYRPQQAKPPTEQLCGHSYLRTNRIVLELQNKIPQLRRQLTKADPRGSNLLLFEALKCCLNALNINTDADASFSELVNNLDHNLTGQIDPIELLSLFKE